MISPAEFEAKMLDLQARFRNDEEAFHGAADDLLVETLTALGYGDGCKIFENTPKWYS